MRCTQSSPRSGRQLELFIGSQRASSKCCRERPFRPGKTNEAETLLCQEHGALGRMHSSLRRPKGSSICSGSRPVELINTSLSLCSAVAPLLTSAQLGVPRRLLHRISASEAEPASDVPMPLFLENCRAGPSSGSAPSAQGVRPGSSRIKAVTWDREDTWFLMTSLSYLPMPGPEGPAAWDMALLPVTHGNFR